MPVNHEYDDKQTDVRWEDHTKLTTMAANIICKKSPELLPHFDDIRDDLLGVLWECTRKREDGYGYNPDKGRFSTYAMRAMIRKHRDYKRLYINHLPQSIRSQGVKVHQMTDKGEKYLNSTTEDTARTIDLREITDDLLGRVSDTDQQFFRKWMETGELKSEAAKAVGISRTTSQVAEDRIKRVVKRIEKDNPQTIAHYREALGVSA